LEQTANFVLWNITRKRSGFYNPGGGCLQRGTD